MGSINPIYWRNILNKNDFLDAWKKKMGELQTLEFDAKKSELFKKAISIFSGNMPPNEEISDSQAPFIVKYKNTYGSIMTNQARSNLFYKNLYDKNNRNVEAVELVWIWNDATNNLSILLGDYSNFFMYLSKDKGDIESKESMACVIALIRG